jgi:hypothetical protein
MSKYKQGMDWRGMRPSEGRGRKPPVKPRRPTKGESSVQRGPSDHAMARIVGEINETRRRGTKRD